MAGRICEQEANLEKIFVLAAQSFILITSHWGFGSNTRKLTDTTRSFSIKKLVRVSELSGNFNYVSLVYNFGAAVHCTGFGP